MYKIELNFQSNVPGIYTNWTETADNSEFFRMKLNRILDYWLQSMCPYVDLTKLPFNEDYLNNANFKYQLIQNHIRYLNSINKKGDVKREFIIKSFQGDVDFTYIYNYPSSNESVTYITGVMTNPPFNGSITLN